MLDFLFILFCVIMGYFAFNSIRVFLKLRNAARNNPFAQAQQQFQQQQQQQAGTRQQRTQHDTVLYTQEHEKVFAEDEGEYVDFEELPADDDKQS